MAHRLDNGCIRCDESGYWFCGKGPYARVTAVKAMKGHGDVLIDWAARTVAEEAKRLAIRYRLGYITGDELADALTAGRLASAHKDARDAAADFGTVFHVFVEEWASGVDNPEEGALRGVRRIADCRVAQELGLEPPERGEAEAFERSLPDHGRERLRELKDALEKRLAEDAKAFLSWAEERKPEFLMNEFQVFSDRHMYAGTVDADVVVDGKRYLLDVKTSRKPYKDFALQLSAYMHADFIGLPDGETADIPPFDGGAILHVRDGKANLYEVDCGEKAYEAFLACLMLYRYEESSKEPVKV